MRDEEESNVTMETGIQKPVRCRDTSQGRRPPCAAGKARKRILSSRLQEKHVVTNIFLSAK